MSLQLHNFGLLIGPPRYFSTLVRANGSATTNVLSFDLDDAEHFSTLVRVNGSATLREHLVGDNLAQFQYPRSGQWLCNRVRDRHLQVITHFSTLVRVLQPTRELTHVGTNTQFQYPRSGQWLCNLYATRLLLL